MPGKVTIKDIAREAGVSIALVSFVMNNRIGADGKQKYRVSEATRDRVLEVAKAHNYRPNSAARMLRRGRSNVLGVILSDLSNLFYGTIAHYIEQEAGKTGFTVLFGSTEEDPERFGRLVQSFLEKDVDGFVVVPCQGSYKYVDMLRSSGKPFVVIDRHSPGYVVPSVLTDNRDAMFQAYREIRRQGAKKIDMVSYSMRISSMTDREEAFRWYAGEDAKIFHLSFDSVREDAEKAVDEIIARGTDGIITASNVPCVEIVKALIRRGLTPQKDIRIVGFDYSNIYEMFNPRISYVQQPLREIAKEASACLFRLIRKKADGEDIHFLNEQIILKAKTVL